MDDWIQNKAHQAHKTGGVRVHVCVTSVGAVCGLFAFKNEFIAPAEVSKSAAGGLDNVPAILLAQMALDQSVRGGKFPLILLEVLRVCTEIDARMPIRLLVLDAENEKLAGKYKALGFVPFQSNPSRLYMPMKQVRAAVIAARAAAEAEFERAGTPAG